METALRASPTFTRGTRMSMKLYFSHFGILNPQILALNLVFTTPKIIPVKFCSIHVRSKNTLQHRT